MKKAFTATLDNLHDMMQFVRDESLALGFSEDVACKIEVAIEEALVNIINYAYPGNSAGAIEIDCNQSKSQRGLEVVIKDSGIPFDPIEQAPPPSFDVPAEKKPIGGYGIFIIRKMMDSVKYRHENGQNVLTLVKFL